MMFRIVPRITAKLLLTPRRRPPIPFLWGLGLGAVAGLALASTLAQRLAVRPRTSESRATANGAAPTEEPVTDQASAAT